MQKQYPQLDEKAALLALESVNNNEVNCLEKESDSVAFTISAFFKRGRIFADDY